MHHFGPFLWLTVLISTASGCLRVGLPEHVAGDNLFQNHREPGLPTPPINTVLINAGEIDPSRSFGNQFVLLIFPTSRVYLEHGFKRMAAEILTEELSSKGMVVAETDSVEKGVALFRATPSASRIVLLKHAEISATVYDLLFTRRATASGTINLSILSPQDGSTVANEVLEIHEGEFRSAAFGPAITNLIERGIRNSLTTATIFNLEPPRSSTTFPQAPTCLIPPPKLPNPLPPSFADEVTLSYGFKRLKAFDTAQLSRLIQRGILSGMDSLGIACGITIDQGRATGSSADRLVLTIHELSLAEDRSAITATVQSNAGASSAKVVTPIRPDVDGALAFALEELGRDSVTALNLGLVAQEQLK